MEHISATIIDVTNFSTGYPVENSQDTLLRDHYLANIENELENSMVLFLEGQEDAGKTTLCAQFCKKLGNDALSVFFNPLNNFDYDLSFLFTNVTTQVKFLVQKDITEIESDAFASQEEYRSQLFQLQKLAKKNRRPFYFVLDGLEDKLYDKTDIIKSIIDVLPLGQDYFRFIISGSKNQFLELDTYLRKIPSKSLTVTGFSFTEITQYLKIESISPTERTELFKISGGFPGRLKTLKRLLAKNEGDLGNLLHSNTYKTWIEKDCSKIDLENQPLNLTLSIVALSSNLFNLDELAKIANIPTDKLNAIVEDTFVFEIVDNCPRFISPSYKKYFQNVLRGNQRKIEDIILNFYASDESIKSKSEMVRMLAERQQWQKITPLINEDYIKKTINSTGAIQNALQGLNYGIKAAEALNQYSSLWKYSIQGSIVQELDNFLFWDSEIQARLSLKDFSGAIQLAESAILKVDRLRLLALIARKEKEINKKVDEDLIGIIKEVYASCDLSSVGDKIYDIVSDLLYSLPNLAIELIEKTSGNTSENNINDWIVAKLSMAAITSSGYDKHDNDSKSDVLKTLNNPNTDKINRAVNFLVGNYSAHKVLDEVKKLTDSKERLRLLRLYLRNNHSNYNNIDKVIETALDELVKSSSQAVLTLNVLKELSYQLAHVSVFEKRVNLVKRFRAIESTIDYQQDSKDSFIYELNIFHTDFSLYKERALTSLEKIVRNAERLTDKSVQLQAFSEIYSKLKVVRSHFFKHVEKSVSRKIVLLANEIFAHTANHFKVCESFIPTIGKNDPHLGLQIANCVNTSLSRDRSRLLILHSYLDNNLKNVEISSLQHIHLSFENEYPKQLSLRYILERYSEAKSLHFNVIKELQYFIDQYRIIDLAVNKIYALCLSYKIVAKNPEWKEKLANSFRDRLLTNWESVNSDWEKIDSGYRICSEIAKLDHAFAKKLFNDCENVKNEGWLDSNSIAETYLLSVNLAIRAYSNLHISNQAKVDDYKIIETLIGRIPSEREKLSCWTETALLLLLNDADSTAKNIYNHHIVPLLESNAKSNIEDEAVINSMIVLHVHNPQLATEYLQKMTLDGREESIVKIVNFYVLKRIPFEVYEGQLHKYSCDYTDIFKAVGILELIQTDRLISLITDEIRRAIVNNKNTFSTTQIADIASKLRQITSKKLPDKHNIQHDGYVILTNFNIDLIKKQGVDWEKYVNAPSRIENLSDSIFVYTMLLENFQFEKMKDGSKAKAQMVNNIYDGLECLPSNFEYIERIIDLSSKLYDLDKIRWKGIIQKAFEKTTKIPSAFESNQLKRRIIENVHKHDFSFAKQLTGMAEGSVGIDQKDMLKDFFETLEITKKIKENQSVEQKDKESCSMIVDAIYKAQGALNSERIVTRKITEAAKYLRIGNILPISEVFPVYHFYLNNCGRTYRTATSDKSIMKIHRENFHEAVNASSLVEIFSLRRKNTENSNRKFFLDKEFKLNQVVTAGSREQAMNFIKNWMVDEMREFVIIADPYFKKEDLDILKIIKEVNENIEIDVLACEEGKKSNVEELFRLQWTKISDQSPPFTNITFCWVPEDKNIQPIHDRWIITKDGGLRLGTSLNSMGDRKDSEISVMNSNEALNILENTLKDYIYKRKKEINSQRLSYKSFSF